MRTYNGRTLEQLEQICTEIEAIEDLGFDATLGDESEGARTILDLVKHLREIQGSVT
jgi:hypothetical protein